MRTARRAAILNSEQFCLTQASDTQFQSGVQSRKFIKAVHNSPLHIPIAHTKTPASLALHTSKPEVMQLNTCESCQAHLQTQKQEKSVIKLWKSVEGALKKWYTTQGPVFFKQYNSFNGNFCSMITFSHPGEEFCCSPQGCYLDWTLLDFPTLDTPNRGSMCNICP